MKKIRSLKFILILIFVMVFIPKNVHAATTSRAFTGNAEWYQQQGYYYGLPDVHNGVNGGYLIDDVETKAFPSNSNYYLLRSLDTNNGMIYVLKQLTLRSNVSVENGKVYSVQLLFAGGSALRYGNEIDTSLYNISNDSECSTDVGTCSYYWTNDHYAIITLVPNKNSSSYYIRLGNQANEDKALVINTYTQGFQGIEIRSSSIQNSDSSTDIGPLINQQQITNQKLDDINNNINNTNNKINDVNDNLNNINDSINDSDTTQSQNTIGNFFNNFTTTDNGGLSDILTAPLRLLNNLLSVQNSCQPLSFPLPIVHNQVTLPCFSTIVFTHFQVFYDVYNIIISGIICYYIIRNLFLKINDLKNPDNDRLEVYDL